MNRRLPLASAALIALLAGACAENPAGEDDGPAPELDVPYDTALEASIQFDNAFVPEGYADMASTPTGQAHVGIHYSPVASYDADMPYYAMADGAVTTIEPFVSGGRHAVNVQMDLSGNIVLVYQFETESTDAADGTAQLAKIAVGEGQVVKRGDLIGTLHDAGAPAPIFHLGVIEGSDLICPEKLLSADALARTLALITRDNPTWKICYGD